ncbi:MAG: sulfate transporter CysZ [Gammaproteobacteria bacterium]|jgi:CysZ protein|nr:sulfate transporter CysZ [Gammaproteobacteria bacterium]MBT3723120.1 sulfate transporter CysZ [Gammaproteobacteria bacterium]MBT4077215.1 sulfate transporter CysZ [Gammaproteobacteria bacterium]MBT4192715.1 sulfate transporter CysZ [Gammaproteobacteria bacterium]MBT4451724.1 sulfate transporter CysZ [Gammaproteobacteria bacterium]
MIADIGRGTGYLAKGLSLISSKGIKRYVLIPLSLNIFLFGALIWTGYSQFAPTVEWMMSFVPGWLSFLESILWLFITSLTAIIVFFIFTPVANIIAAPFNAIMAEKVEELLTGKDINSNISLMTIIKDSIMSQIGKLVYILLWSLLLLLISFIPVINLISPFLWIIFGSWLLSLEYLDYPMGNHDLTFKQQKETLKKRRGLSLGFGGSVMILTSIPIVNFIVMPVAVAGATAMWVDQLSASTSLTR